MTVGFAAAVDVDLSLVAEDRPPCLYHDCGSEAVWAGIISTPCGCPQPVCVRHHKIEVVRWQPGDHLLCFFCPKNLNDEGQFIRWERL
jgi:hypothetical protein